jgi:hypothetical protein
MARTHLNSPVSVCVLLQVNYEIVTHIASLRPFLLQELLHEPSTSRES